MDDRLEIAYRLRGAALVVDRGGTVRLSDVARHAGVSLATASRALNGSARTVNAELQQRVHASAAALRYTANAQAQAVARGTSRTVALVLGDIADPYFSAVASGVVREAEERGLVVTMATGGADGEREVATLVALTGQRPRALIMASSRRVSASADTQGDADVIRELAAIERTGGRVSFIGSGPAGFRVVDVRNREGAAALADALFERGYRDFAVLAGPEDLVTARERSGGFIGALDTRGSAPGRSRRIRCEFSRAGGHRAMAGLLDSGAHPQCVFAVTDVMALGAMAAMRARGIEPGRDIAVAGFDDIQLLQDVTPALTTVGLPLAEMGAQALRLALDEMDATVAVTGRLILRDSTPNVGSRD